MNFLSETVLGTLGTCNNQILHVPRPVLEKLHFCMSLRNVLKKVSCFDAPARLGAKGADYGEYQIQTCLSSSTSLFWYKSKITNFFSESWLKGKLKQYKLAFPSCYRHPNQASCRSCSAKEPLIIGLFCGKWPEKIRHPMTLRHRLLCDNETSA